MSLSSVPVPGQASQESSQTHTAPYCQTRHARSLTNCKLMLVHAYVQKERECWEGKRVYLRMEILPLI